MDDEDSDGAEEAFGALRIEVKNLRRVVEALPQAWKANRPADITPTLIEMAQALKEIGEHLAVIEEHPALRALDQAAAESRQVRQELAGMIGAARRQDQQFKWVFGAAGAAFVVALLISPVLARLLPFGLDG